MIVVTAEGPDLGVEVDQGRDLEAGLDLLSPDVGGNVFYIRLSHCLIYLLILKNNGSISAYNRKYVNSDILEAGSLLLLLYHM